MEIRKLRACRHENANAYEYIRNDGMINDIVSTDDYNRRRALEDHLTGMRFCLDCGSTQRFRFRDPIKSSEPWLAPWIWRK